MQFRDETYAGHVTAGTRPAIFARTCWVVGARLLAIASRPTPRRDWRRHHGEDTRQNEDLSAGHCGFRALCGGRALARGLVARGGELPSSREGSGRALLSYRYTRILHVRTTCTVRLQPYSQHECYTAVQSYAMASSYRNTQLYRSCELRRRTRCIIYSCTCRRSTDCAVQPYRYGSTAVQLVRLMPGEVWLQTLLKTG